MHQLQQQRVCLRACSPSFVAECGLHVCSHLREHTQNKQSCSCPVRVCAFCKQLSFQSSRGLFERQMRHFTTHRAADEDEPLLRGALGVIKAVKGARNYSLGSVGDLSLALIGLEIARSQISAKRCQLRG